MKITAVGGYNAVGRNMTGITVGGETIAVDNGLRLDTLQLYDTESYEMRKFKLDELVRMKIIPDHKMLDNVIAQVVSHGHLDHVGGTMFTKPKVPIITTPYAAEIGRKEYKEGDFYARGYGDPFDVKSRSNQELRVELIEITHSIPHTSIPVLYTPEGIVVYANDFKLDNHSKIAAPDYHRLKQIGKEGVKAFIVESVRAGETGKTPSEMVARANVKDVFESIADSKGLIISTTFSSHIERIQAILDMAEYMGRVPVILGRSLHFQVQLAKRFGLLEIPPHAEIFANAKAVGNALKKIDKGRREDYLLLVTGHQGEQKSVLCRMADSKFPFGFRKKDNIVFCTEVIPNPVNETNRYVLERKLKSFGVRIFRDIHVSGHASKEDHRRLLNLLKPERIIPAHGGIEMRANYANLASEEGYEINKNVHLLDNGSSIEI